MPPSLTVMVRGRASGSVPAGGSSSSASDVHAASIRMRAQARDAAGGNME